MATDFPKEKAKLIKTGWPEFDRLAGAIFDTACSKLLNACSEWAEECYDAFKNKVPVDTGNLKNAIDIDDSGWPYSIGVGVNESKLLGPKTLQSTIAFTPKRGVGKKRHIPARNYVLDSDEKGTPLEERTRDITLRMFVSVIWAEQAKLAANKNLRSI